MIILHIHLETKGEEREETQCIVCKMWMNEPQTYGYINFKSATAVYLLLYKVYCHSSFSAVRFFFTRPANIASFNIASSHLIYGGCCPLKLARKLLQSNLTLTCQVSLFKVVIRCVKRRIENSHPRRRWEDTAGTWYLTRATVGLWGLGSISRYRKQCEGDTWQYWQSAAIMQGK